jgi:uncharacterized protein
MQDLLNLILKNITTNPEDIRIETAEENGQTVFTIHVNPEDMGRVIGKSGKVIRAIRSLAHVVGIRQNERYRINVAEVAGAEGEVAVAATTDATKTEPVVEEANDEDLITGAFDVAVDAEAEVEAESETEAEAEAEVETEAEVEVEAKEPAEETEE